MVVGVAELWTAGTRLVDLSTEQCFDDSYLVDQQGAPAGWFKSVCCDTCAKSVRPQSGGSGGGTQCTDTANGAQDQDGNDCGYYTSHPGDCGGLDDADFQAQSMCCGCGGGSSSHGCVDDHNALAAGTNDNHHACADGVTASHNWCCLGGRGYR